MSLRQDVNAGLVLALTNDPAGLIQLDDEGVAVHRLRLPPYQAGLPALDLRVVTSLGPEEKSFTLSCVIKHLDETPSQEGLLALLNQGIFPYPAMGSHFAVDESNNTLALVQHWLVSSILPEQFKELYVLFGTGAAIWHEKFVAQSFDDVRLRQL